MDNCLFETYKNSTMPHGSHMYKTASEISMDTMCAYLSTQHGLQHWKFVLLYCADISSIDLSIQESDRHHSNTYPSIHFHIYH